MCGPPLRRLALLLDIDGTLALTDPLYVKAFQQLMSADFGIDVDELWFAENVAGKVDADVFTELLPAGATAEDLRKASLRKDTLFCENVREHGCGVVSGLDGFFALVKERQYHCVAVSNAQRGGCEAVLALLKRELQHAQVISDLVVGSECARAKPFPDPYLEAIRRLGVAPHDCLVTKRRVASFSNPAFFFLRFDE